MGREDCPKRATADPEFQDGTLKLALVAAFAAAAVYAPTLRHQFLWDDIPQILDNPWMRDFRSLPVIFSSDSWIVQQTAGYYRPLLHTVYLILYQTFGPNPVAFHAANVLLHGLNTALVVLFVRRLHGSIGGDRAAGPGFSLVAGLMFAVHPANASVVAWAQGMDNTLCACFGLAALLAHQRTGRLWAALAALGLVLAAFSRETAAVFPPLMVLTDLVGARQPWLGTVRTRLPRYCLYAAALVGYLAIRARALGALLTGGPGSPFDGKSLLLDGPVLFALNLRTLFIPFPLAVRPPYLPVQSPADPRFAASVVVIALLAFIALRLAKRSPLGFLGLAFVTLPLLLVVYLPANGLPLGNHRLYLPTAGLGLVLAAALFRERAAPAFLKRHRTRIGVAVAVILGAWTLAWSPVYADSLTFWRAAVRNTPEAWMPHLHLGIALAEAKRDPEAVVELEMAGAIAPRNPLAHYHLAGIYLRQGRRDLASAEYRTALAVDPAHFPSLSDLAQLELDSEHDKEALALLQRAVKIAPGHPWVRDRLGAALFLNGYTAAGIAELKAAAELAPWDAEIRRHLEQAQQLLRAPTGPGAQ